MINLSFHIMKKYYITIFIVIESSAAIISKNKKGFREVKYGFLGKERMVTTQPYYVK